MVSSFLVTIPRDCWIWYIIKLNAKERQGRYFALSSIVTKFITSFFQRFFQRKTLRFSVFSEKSAQIQRKWRKACFCRAYEPRKFKCHPPNFAKPLFSEIANNPFISPFSCRFSMTLAACSWLYTKQRLLSQKIGLRHALN